MRLFLCAVLLHFATLSIAGELTCGFGGCRLDAVISDVKWKPTNCEKPPPPYTFFGTTAREYNLAVDSFNRWISIIDLYIKCVRSEADTDSRKVPAIISDGLKNAEQEVSDEVQHERLKLQMMRPQ